MTRTAGYVCLVLHAHLPFVRHPEHENFLEERWLYEAITECYLPLVESLEHLEAERVPFRLTLSLSPTLLAMLDDPLLRRRYLRYLQESVKLAEREVAHTAGGPEEYVAHFYRHRLRQLLRLYARHHGDIAGAFHRFARAGYLELITCGATHGFLPLYQHQPEAVRAQILVATDAFRRRFGHAPRGFWLPECGYFPGVDRFLREAGVEYLFTETHGLTGAPSGSPRGTYAHGWTTGGVAVFARDPVSSKQVWSAAEGYPGDAAYREFYRDIGFERDPDHLGGLAGPDGIRVFSGFKYRRITGPSDSKDLYDRWAAEQTAVRHAGHFVRQRARQAAEARESLPAGPPPLMVAPYDAELFGHWWYEGPFFLEQVARQAVSHPEVRFVTPGDYLDLFRPGQGTVEPAFSSWGDEGYADFWCNDANHWIYRHLHGAGRRMQALAVRHREEPDTNLRRVLNQAARELLLAQASDWAFLMRTGTAADYAGRRQRAHLGRFHRLTENPNAVPPAWLAQVEAADNLFPHLDYHLYAP